MPIEKFPIEYPENEDQINNPVGGSFQKNDDLQAYYKGQRDGYERDEKYLGDQIQSIDNLQKPLIAAAKPIDKSVAESVVRYNEAIDAIVEASDDAVSCGCTFTQDPSSGTAMTMTVMYEDFIADEKNLNSLSYGGDEPLNDAGDIKIVDSSGSPTSIDEGSLGDGQDSTITDGEEVEYFEISNIEPFGSCGNCIDLYNQQQAAFQAADDAQDEDVRDGDLDKVNSIKEEREEVLKERWSLGFGKEETTKKKNRVDGFLDAENYKGAP